MAYHTFLWLPPDCLTNAACDTNRTFLQVALNCLTDAAYDVLHFFCSKHQIV
jgi:hypothetical protein